MLIAEYCLVWKNKT